jgi:DNA-binding winged helix-turn-helix (wHTH) protein/TolB-like protein
MTYEFGIFEWDPAKTELRKSGRLVSLEPQPARVLDLLLARSGDIVSREEMIAHVWGTDTHVDFNRGLAYCVAQVRAALGDSGDNPRFVQTLPKRGFKFIAPVQLRVPPINDNFQGTVKTDAVGPAARGGRFVKPAAAAMVLFILAAAGAWSARALMNPGRPVVAVSVFDNETGISQYDRPINTMADVVVDRLTSIGPDRIGVVGNASVLRMPRSRRDLDTIKTGTGASFAILAQLQKRDAGLLFIIHLIRLDDGTHLWTGRIDRPDGDTLAGLDEAAARAIDTAVRRFITHDSAAR